MQSARVCVQNFDNGDIQGFLYIDTGNGESLVTTSPRYANGTPSASFFSFSGSAAGMSGTVAVTAAVNVSGAQVNFTITVGTNSPSMVSQTLTISSQSC